jgi:hypothetical protein
LLQPRWALPRKRQNSRSRFYDGFMWRLLRGAARQWRRQQRRHPSLKLSRDACTGPPPPQFLRATCPIFPRSFPRVAAAAWLTRMLVCTVHLSLASASGSGCMACLPLQLAVRQCSLVLGLSGDMRAISDCFDQRAGAPQGGAAWRVVGGGERGCRRAGHAPPHVAAAARMARDAVGRGGRGERAAGCTRYSSGSCAALCRSLGCCRCFKALRARSAQLLARAWLPNNALATRTQHFAACASSAHVLQ